MKLIDIFNAWGQSADRQYATKQWLLSKWEVNEGVEWPEEKTQIMLKSLLEGLDPTPESCFIELGCAGGWILEHLLPHVKSGYGFDFSIEMLRFAHEAMAGNQFICGDIGRIPFKDESFDRVLSYYVFLNFDDDKFVQQGIFEVIRILKKGGRALIGQLPKEEGSSRYEQAKEDYAHYCQEKFDVGKSNREDCKPPLRLFDKDKLIGLLQSQNVKLHFQNSFNPFYYSGQSESVDWRFDLIIEKG